MITVSKQEINVLVQEYLRSEGYYHTLFTFTNEAMLSDSFISTTEYSLVDLVIKGTKFSYVENHIMNDKLVECNNDFIISKKHVCDAKSTKINLEEDLTKNKLANLLTDTNQKDLKIEQIKKVEQNDFLSNCAKKENITVENEQAEKKVKKYKSKENVTKELSEELKDKSIKIEKVNKTRKKKKSEISEGEDATIDNPQQTIEDDKKVKQSKISPRKTKVKKKIDETSKTEKRTYAKKERITKKNAESKKSSSEKSTAETVSESENLRLEKLEQYTAQDNITQESTAQLHLTKLNLTQLQSTQLNLTQVDLTKEKSKGISSITEKDLSSYTGQLKTDNSIDSTNKETIEASESIFGKSGASNKFIGTALKEHTGDVSVCSWSNNILATGSDDSTLRVYKDGKMIKMKRLNTEITSLAWNKNNELSAGNYQGEIYTFTDHKDTLVHKHHFGPVFAMKYHNDHLLSVSYDGKAGILNDKLSLIKVHNKSILDCDWINENRILTCSSDCDIGIVDINTLEIEYLKGHSDEVNCISYKNDIIASSSDDSKVILWNTINQKNLVLSGHEKSVFMHKWTSDSLCSIGAEGFVIQWDLEKGDIKQKFIQEKSVHAIDYSNSSNLIISGGAEKCIVFYDNRFGEVKRYNTKGSIYDVKLSGTETYLCVCMAYSHPVVFDLRYC